MTPESIAGLVRRWVRFYSRNVPEPIARRRIEEIDADLDDHIAHERDRGSGDRRIALQIASRTIRGLAADASWRALHTSGSARRSIIRVALVTAIVLSVPAVAMQFSEEAKWSTFDFAFAAVLLLGAGALVELAVRRPRNSRYRAATAAVGVLAIVLGEADDAPGLVLFGLVLMVGALVLTVRTAQRSG